MAIHITRDDVFNFLVSSGVGPFDEAPSANDLPKFFEWLNEQPVRFAQQNPTGVLEAVLDIAFNPPRQHFSEYFDDIKFVGGDLLAACSRFVPDLFIDRMTVLLPLAVEEITRCTLFHGLGESCLPQSFELLKSLVTNAPDYSDFELVCLIDELGGLGLHLKRVDETLNLLHQIQKATPAERAEIHKELKIFFEAIDKAI